MTSPWSKAELARLRQLAISNLPVEEFNIPGRSASACYTAMKRHSIVRPGKDPSDSRHVHWSDTELAKLRRQAKSARALKDFSIEGKTRNAIDTKLRELQLHPSYWGDEELALLRKQAETARSLDDFSITGKRKEVIARKLTELGLHPADRPWSDGELAALEALFKSGKRLSEWHIPGRSLREMRREGKKRGFRRVRPSELRAASAESRKPWSHSELQTLRTEIGLAKAPSEITIAGRTTASIRNQAKRLGLVGDGVSRKAWSTEQEQRVQDYHAEGLSALAIAKREDPLLKGKSATAIQKKLTRLGLIDEVHSQRGKEANRLSEEAISRLHAFLRQYAHRATPEQLALSWNRQCEEKVSRSKVVYHLEQLGIKPSQKEVRRMPFSKAKQRTPTANQKAASTRRWEEYRSKQQKELAAAATQRRREARASGQAIRERQCRNPSCPKRYPAEPPFFYATQKKTKAGVHTYLSQYCRMCENERRRDCQ